MEDVAGNFVSVISIDEERIEGILHKVDLPNEAIVMKNARNYGSEGRRARGPQTPPSLQLMATITLGSRRIKDMEIIFLSPQERTFPSLSQHKTGPKNQVDRPSWSEVVEGKKN